MQYELRRRFGGKGAKRDQMAEALRGICVDGAGLIYAAGDSAVKVFDSGGALQRHWRTSKPAYCVSVGNDGGILVGEPGQVERFDGEGRKVGVLEDAPRLGLVTAVAYLGQEILAGDATHRSIRRYDANGKFLNDIGSDNRTKGFLIPNGSIDFALDARGVIHAANPGKHRVERYNASGELLGRMGKFTGPSPEGFSGCCNPTNVAVTKQGHVVVTVKAPPGVKVYDAKGKLLALFGTDLFDLNCMNMDVAVDVRGSVYVADTVRCQICAFAQQETGETKPVTAPVEGTRDR